MLNVNPNDKEKVNAVRQMMVNAGLQHTPDDNPDNWFWSGGEINNMYVDRWAWRLNNLPELTRANMGVEIGLDAIANLYTSTGMAGSEIVKSINRIYRSAINFFNYADTGLKSDIAASIINFALPAMEAEMILANVDYYNNFNKNGISTDSMVSGNPRRTSEFDVTYGDLELVKKDPTIKEFFEEDHTGIDYGRGGTDITIPEGYWQIIQIDNHRIYLQLLGSDLKLRIMHLNPAELEKLTKGSIFGGSNPLEIKYPTEVYGTGTGPHIHIDMTMNLPYNNQYTWQFVNPADLLPGSRLHYYYGTKDSNNNYLPNSRKAFNREWIF
jgi:hypothetical protein